MAARASGSPEPPRGRVLVVDDVQDMAESNALMLQTRGLDTVVETDPETAFDRIDESIACIVGDYQMPNMNGLELLDKVREEYPQMPFILFTGRGSEGVASDAIEAGVDHYLQKGGVEQYDRLANCVENAIEQSPVPVNCSGIPRTNSSARRSRRSTPTTSRSTSRSGDRSSKTTARGGSSRSVTRETASSYGRTSPPRRWSTKGGPPADDHATEVVRDPAAGPSLAIGVPPFWTRFDP